MRTVKRHEEKFDSSNPHIDSYISDEPNKYRRYANILPILAYILRTEEQYYYARHAVYIRQTLQRGKPHQEQKPVNDLVE